MDVSRHALRFLRVVLTCQDGEWDGYEMYEMDAGSGDEGRRRAAFDDNIAAQVRGPVCPPAPSSAAQFACCPLEFRVRVSYAPCHAPCRIVKSCVSPAAAPSPCHVGKQRRAGRGGGPDRRRRLVYCDTYDCDTRFVHDATIIAVFGITWDTAADTSRSTPDTTEEEQGRAPAQAASLHRRRLRLPELVHQLRLRQ